MLLFKKKFLEAIRSGTKTQTVRLWNVCRFRAGQRSYIPGVGYIWIDAVDPVRIEDLTDDDARLDGFPSADALRAELRTLYAEQLAAGYQAYRLRFRRMSEEEAAVAKSDRIAVKRSRNARP
ncbi:MAG: ASCH domain-containing protein [Planctomycetales bacterium]|nr:ASCH domain-containing protein [Planctomycetales bacterium]MBN8624391.1 ASCH domain-containing protein [Planctomycetota bacterium]